MCLGLQKIIVFTFGWGNSKTGYSILDYAINVYTYTYMQDVLFLHTLHGEAHKLGGGALSTVWSLGADWGCISLHSQWSGCRSCGQGFIL